MATDLLNLFTQALRSEFIKGYEIVAEPPPLDKALQRIPSTGRIENYAWLTPPPGMSDWQGYRRYAKLGDINYRVPNLKYDAALSILQDDIDDDQTGGYMIQAAGIGKQAKIWPIIKAQILLSNGQTTACFDGSNFFATSHNVGTGSNLISAAAAATDAVTHCFVALVTDTPVKPVIWQDRKGPVFGTTAGTPQSDEQQKVNWWVTMRGAAAFGWWWNAVMVKFANTPTLAELLTALGQVKTQLYGFKLPKNLGTDVDQYMHAQTKFEAGNLTIVASTGLAQLMSQALRLSLIAQTENIYKDFATLSVSGYLNSVV